jgi:hypothetical protein
MEKNMQQSQTIEIKDIIYNIVRTKKKIEAMKREVSLLEAQVEQQQKFIEESVVDEMLQAAAIPPAKDKKDTKEPTS